MTGLHVGKVNVEDSANAELVELGPSSFEVVDLEDRHVAAVAAAPFEEPAGGRGLMSSG